MGFMDKLGDDDDQEEVELKPSSVDTSPDRAPTRRRKSGEVELEDSSSDEDDDAGGGLLPGMSSSATESAGSSSSRSTGSNARSREDRLEKVIEQNKKIIGLLEEISGKKKQDTNDIW